MKVKLVNLVFKGRKICSDVEKRYMQQLDMQLADLWPASRQVYLHFDEDFSLETTVADMDKIVEAYQELRMKYCKQVVKAYRKQRRRKLVARAK